MKKKTVSEITLTLLLTVSIILNMIVSVGAQTTSMSVINPDTGDNSFIFYTNTTTVGTCINATVWVYDVNDLLSYQVYLALNDTILNITNAWIPTWDPNWVFSGKTTVDLPPVFYDLDEDGFIESVKMGAGILGGDTFTGSGLVAIIEFEIIYSPTTGSVSSSLKIDNPSTYLLDSNGEEILASKINGYYEYNYVGVHDVAVTDVALSKTIIGQGYSMSVNVTVGNQGDVHESFNVTLTATCTTAITVGTKQINNLLPSQNVSLTFTWLTSLDTLKGNYTVTAIADIVPGEIDTADNTLIDGMVLVTIPGDVNGDHVVDMKDIFQIILHFMCERYFPCYVANCDVNCDGVIDMKDIFIPILHFMESW